MITKYNQNKSVLKDCFYKSGLAYKTESFPETEVCKIRTLALTLAEH